MTSSTPSMNRFRSGTVAALAAAAFVAACGDEPSPLAPVLDGPPALAVVETPTPDDVLLATTDVPDDVDRNGTATAKLSLASQIGGAGGLDIMTLLDASGSVGEEAFEQETDFVSAIASNTLPETPDGRTRMGIIRFATDVDLLYELTDDQSSSAVQVFAEAIEFTGGWTNTLGALQQSIDHFDANSAGRGKVIVLITDGVPLLFGTNQQVCNLVAPLQSRGISVFIVGVGSQFQTSRVDCLVNDPTTDIILASSFDPEDLVAALSDASTFVNPQVSGVTLTATVAPDFEVVAGPTKSETILIDGVDPSLPSYDAATRTLTWSLDPVDRRIRNITLDLAPASGNSPVCGLKPALTGLQVDYDDPDTGTPLSATLPDVDIEVTGCPPPVVTPTVTGTLGDDGWYTSDVTVSWTVESVEAVDQLDGCDEVTVTEDTDGTDFTCTATSVAGDGSATVPIKRDATAPVITFGGNVGTYLHGEQIEITCSVEDATSGVATFDCPLVSAPATDFAPGTYTLEASATDNAGNTATASTTFDVVANNPPVADAGSDQTVECTTAGAGETMLNGSLSSDPDGDALTYSWSEGGGEIATGVSPTVNLSLGTHTITLMVDDGNGGTDTDDVVIDVVDTTPPDLTVTASPESLLPPNHKYKSITLAVSAEDTCDDNPSVEAWVQSDEPDDARGNGDGRTTGDIRVTLADGTVLESSNGSPSVYFDLDDLHKLELRTEQAGRGAGRTYTIMVKATDSSGNESTETATVMVPHDRRR